MPNPASDADQLRFAQLRDRMFDSLTKNLPSAFMESAGAQSRKGFRDKLMESDIIISIVECCAYEALCIEEESRGRHPQIP